MLGLTFSSKLDWVSYIISIVKTVTKKIGALIRSVKFLSPEVALYPYKSTIRPCMEYCCLFWAGAPSCYLELLDKLQKRICRAVGPSFAASLEPLAHRRNMASISLFYRYYFGRCSSELAHLVSLPFSRGGLLFIKQNIVISCCRSLCLLRLVLLSSFSMADIFQFFDTLLCDVLNVTSYHLCRSMKNCVYNNFNLRYLVSSVIESLLKSFSSYNLKITSATKR